MTDRTLDLPASSDLPSFTVKANGAPLDPSWVVSSVTVTHAVDRVPVARLIVRDGAVAELGFPRAASDTLAPGASVEILAGYHSQEESIFVGTATRLRIRSGQASPGTVEVVIKDPVVRMTNARRSAHHDDMTDSDLIDHLVSSYGLTAEVESSEVRHADLVQFECTDWDLMISRARANGKWVLARDGVVRVASPKPEASATTLTYGATMLDVDLRLNAEKQFTGFTTSAWRPSDQAASEVQAEDPGIDSPGDQSSTQLAQASEVGGAHLHHSGSLSDAELGAWADGELMRSRLSRVNGRVRVQGNALARPGDTVTLAGLGARFDGDALVTGVCHRIANGNWTTDFAFGLEPIGGLQSLDEPSAPAAAGLLPSIPGLHVGCVTALAGDPDGDERIRVRLPLVDQHAEGSWARLCADGAGTDRGAILRPDIDDEVVVGFLHGDPRHPIVLGALHSGAHPAPVKADDENHTKGYISRAGVRWTVDDAKPALMLETPGGRSVEIDDDAGHIRLVDNSGNSVTISEDAIAITSVGDILLDASGDLRISASTIEARAQLGLVADGASEAKLTSGGIVTVQGALVKIN